MLHTFATFTSFVWLFLADYGLAQSDLSPFCPQPNGDFPNPASETCTSYFRCTQGKPFPQRCPKEKMFDFLLRSCAPRDEAKCERQLELFITPSTAAPPTWPFSMQNELPASLSSMAGLSVSQQLPPTHLAFLNDQVFPQGAFAQQTPSGQNAFAALLPGQGQQLQGGGVGARQFSQTQGVQAGTAQSWRAQGVSVGSDGTLSANGKNIGKVFPTPHGTVMVFTKQPGQQQAQVPNIRRVNTVTVSPKATPQQNPQQATLSGRKSADQPYSTNQQRQDRQATQPDQPGQTVQSKLFSQFAASLGSSQAKKTFGKTSGDDVSFFANSISRDFSATGNEINSKEYPMTTNV